MAPKRISANWRRRLWAGRAVGIAVSVAAFGIVGTAATLYSGAGNTIKPLWLWAMIAGAGCALLGVATAFLRGQMTFLPSSFCDDLSADVPYKCRYCDSQHLAEACELTRPYYGSEYVSAAVAELWRTANPRGFVEILNSNGELCACFGVLAMTDSFREHFMLGRVADTQMGADCILGPADCRKASHLYISGVVVREPETYIGRKRAWVMVWSILIFLKNVYGVRKKRTLFAIAANRESEQLMKNLGFSLVMEAGQRTDKCPLYTFELSKEGFDKLFARVGDLSPMCECEF